MIYRRMRAIVVGCAMAFFTLGLTVPASSGEPGVLDGRIFTGTSDYSARTNDELINNVVRKVNAVILGRLDGPSTVVKFGHKPVYQVTIIDCYKGNLKPGDKICVLMQGDGETPDVREILEIGKNGFFFINARNEVVLGMAGLYECSPIDIAPYERYGEPMRKLLPTVRQHEAAR